MTIQSGPGTKGTRHISSNYPVDEGLTAGTTKQAGNAALEFEKSFAQGEIHGS